MTMSKRNRGLLLIVLGLALNTHAQDLHFAQTARTPLLINPGAAGVFDGWERVFVNHRNQWLGAGTQFMTTALAVDANIGKSDRQEMAHLGVGIQLFNDIGGDSNFGNQNGSVTFSGILPTGGGHTLSAGIQGGFGQRKADLARVSFMSQWNGTEFSPDIISGEQNSAVNFTYMEVSAGLFYQYKGGQNTFSRNNETKFQLGFSGFHLNAPELKYAGITGERLNRKFVAHADFIHEIRSSNYAFDASVIQIKQGGHYESLLGLMLRYRFEDGTKITGMSQNAYFGFGCYGRIKDAIIPTVLLDWRGFQFGISYDITLSALRKAYSGGSLEFSFSYRNLNHALFKTRKRRF